MRHTGSGILAGFLLLVVGIFVGDVIWDALSPVMAGAAADAMNAVGPTTGTGILIGLVMPLIALILAAGTLLELLGYAKRVV